MSKLTRFLATCLLVTSMSVVALADGNTQTPGMAPPAPTDCTENCPVTDATAPAPDASTVVVDEMGMLVTCLVESIF